MELLRSRKFLVWANLLGGVALGAGVTVGVYTSQASEHPTGYAQAYERLYTDSDKCLHDTPYDPASGAVVNLNKDQQSHEEIVSVLPLAANSYTPSVLFFVLGSEGQLAPADHNTAGFLEEVPCPNQPNGS